MKDFFKTQGVAVATFVGVVVLLWLGLTGNLAGPYSLEAQGITNFDSLTLSNDLIVGDDLTVAGDLALTGSATISAGLTQAENIENVGAFPTLLSVDIDIDNDSSPVTCATIADGEVWVVHAVFANVLDNFVATGDDAALTIGDGNDGNGFLDLADAELQAADTEGTGGTAGWQGYLSTDTIGAYVAQGVPFIYAPSGAAETIDCAFSGTDLASTTGDTSADITIYILYTRIQ